MLIFGYFQASVCPVQFIEYYSCTEGYTLKQVASHL